MGDRGRPATGQVRRQPRADGLTTFSLRVLAADLRDARHYRGRVAFGDELAGPGDAHAYSQSRKSFPEISSS